MTVVGTSAVDEPDGVAVYNLTVDGDHTYFVEPDANTAGTTEVDAVWVHNACNNPWGRLGDLITQQTRMAVEKALAELGFDGIKTEVRFLPGLKALKTRYADVVGTNLATGQRIIVQIGNLSKRLANSPVTRETLAMDDILRSPSFNPAKDIVLFWEKGFF